MLRACIMETSKDTTRIPELILSRGLVRGEHPRTIKKIVRGVLFVYDAGIIYILRKDTVMKM